MGAVLAALSLFSLPFDCRAGDLFVASFVTGNITRINGITGATVYSVNQVPSTINLAKGPDGQLYVTTLFDSTVVKTDLESGAPLGVFASDAGLATTVGITFGPDGTLYVASRDTGAVLRFNPFTGAFLDTFVSSGSGGLNQTEELLFGPDGNLYVTEFDGDRVLRYGGATGAFLGIFASDPSLSGTRGMAFGPDGNLYVSGNYSDNVVRFDGTTGAFLGEFATGILGANGIAFGPDGNLYVASEFGDAIVRVNGTNGTIIDNFASVTGPIGILFDFTPPPTIQTPPQTQTAEAGSTVTLQVRATVPGEWFPSYQWLFNSTNRLNCTNSVLRLGGVHYSQAGAYTVIVTNAAGSVTSPPAMLSVIAPVERRVVPALTLTGQPGTTLNLEFTAVLGRAPAWMALDHVPLTAPSQWYFDLSSPLPPQGFYRTWQSSGGAPPALDLHFVPALTLTGPIGSSVRVDYINQFGPIDAWVTLATVTLTNTTQLYFDTSVIGQPARLWRIMPLP